MAFVKIEKWQMEEKLKPEKGWKETFAGNEFVYDFHLSKRPIIIKVATSIRRDVRISRNRGTDSIRVFAVQKDTTNKEDFKI